MKVNVPGIQKALSFFFLCLSLHLKAQEKEALPYIDVSRITLSDTINSKSDLAYIEKRVSLPENFMHLVFENGVKRRITPKMVEKKAILTFKVCNTSDTLKKFYFFPGFFFTDYTIYRQEGEKLNPLPRVLPQDPDSIGYRLLLLQPGDSATLLVELFFEKTYNNHIRPRLINEAYLDAFIADLHHSKEDLNLITYVFCGLLLAMILFSLANYAIGATPEFLYYSGYALLLGLMLFSKAYYENSANKANFFVETYLDFIMQGIGYICYMAFMQKFLETKRNHLFLYHLYHVSITVLFASICMYSYYHFFTNNFVAENMVEMLTKAFLLLMVIFFIVYGFRTRNDKLLRYLLWGNLALFIFSLLSQLFITFNIRFRSIPDIFNASLFYYELGLLVELIFFLTGLSFKNRRLIAVQARERERLKAENQMKEYEKELAVYKAQQDERSRISADMHDELGAGITVIRLMSEMAKTRMKDDSPVEINKISQSANDLLNKMNTMIWSMNNRNDTVDNLISYIRTYSLEYFENTPIRCKVAINPDVPEKELTGVKRRNVFLCVKESLNNVMKHSNASELQIDIAADGQLEIDIMDNGVGINLQKLRQFGNGIQNMTQRMKSIGGEFFIENKNNGTVTRLRLPLD